MSTEKNRQFQGKQLNKGKERLSAKRQQTKQAVESETTEQREKRLLAKRQQKKTGSFGGNN